MKKVVLFSVLLIAGLALSQFLPTLLGDAYGPVEHVIRMLTMMALAFIMINVGREFEIDKSRLGMYGWDYMIAMTTAAFPWIFVTLYFVFAMLAAAGLSLNLVLTGIFIMIVKRLLESSMADTGSSSTVPELA